MPACSTWRSRARIGGGEIDLPTYIQVIEELGKADASTGWCVNQGAIFATYAARMPREIARTIWIDTPRAVVANTPAPTAKAIVVPGGYRVTGRQGFSTGCRHASWVAAHAQIIENGQMRMEANGQPEARYMFVPVAEAELLDTWHVRGMRGHRHPPLRGERRLRPGRAHRALGDGPAVRGPAALPDPAHAAVRLGRCRGGARHGPHVPGDVLASWPAPRRRGRCRACCASSRWSR